MIKTEFDNLQIGDFVRRSNGKVVGKVFKIERATFKVRVTWTQGLRSGKRTELHYSRLVVLESVSSIPETALATKGVVKTFNEQTKIDTPAESQKTFTTVNSAALATAIRFSEAYETLLVGATDTARVELVKEKFSKDSYAVIVTERAEKQAKVYFFGPSDMAGIEATAHVRKVAHALDVSLETVGGVFNVC